MALVGKGIVFDTGGYDLKPAAGMLSMKKDMGGAATVLAIADMVMGAGLDVQLSVYVPAAENSVSGAAYRPSDVFPSRKGLTVEIGNTDAEGRLVLADALAEADADAPDLLIDMATLTGAARTATGFELPPFFTDDEALAADLMTHAALQSDPMWRLPLWRGYESALNSTVADLTNNPNYGYAGAITAALFLNRFVEKAKSWVHFDIAAWVDRPKPGRRAGAETTAARAIYAPAQGPLRPERQGVSDPAHHAGAARSRRHAAEGPGPGHGLRRRPQADRRARPRRAAPRAEPGRAAGRRTPVRRDVHGLRVEGRLGLGPVRHRRLCRLRPHHRLRRSRSRRRIASPRSRRRS